MIKLFKQVLILITLALLTSCGDSEKQTEEKNKAVVEQKKEQLKAVNEKAIIDLSHKYNSVLGWAKIEPFSYVLQDMFINTGKLITFIGELKDITKLDSTYYLIVYNSRRLLVKKYYIAKISLNHQQFLEIKKNLESKNKKHRVNGCFVFKVSKIITILPQIKSTNNFDGEDSYSYLEYDFHETLFIFKGELIDFYLIKTIENSSE